MSDDDLIRRAEEALESVTPGPWSVDLCGSCTPAHANGVWSQGAQTDVLRDEVMLTVTDAEFIAAAPELVRDLLAAVKELDESVAQWKGLWKGTVETADQWAVERDVANAAIARVEALADKWAAEIDGAARAAAKELHRALVGDDDE